MVRRALIAVVAAGLLAVPLAGAADAPAGKRDGIENAANAGIKIDPAAAQLMESAPVGTCANDPSQDKCPKVTAVVRVYPDADGNYALEPPAVAATREASAAAAPSCALRAGVPYKAAGYEQGDATHECYARITRHELYGQLLKWYNGAWVQMTTRSSALNGPQRIATHPRYRCVKTDVWRNWRHVADAYTLFYGVWYAARSDSGDQNQCG